MLRDAVVLAEVLCAASLPQAKYAVVTVNSVRANAAARLKSDGYLEVHEGAPGAMQLGLRLTPLGLELRAKLQRSTVLRDVGAPNGAA